ncbi:unnamed protein product, partial [Discosporangium mesarthrocarpum]
WAVGVGRADVPIRARREARAAISTTGDVRLRLSDAEPMVDGGRLVLLGEGGGIGNGNGNYLSNPVKTNELRGGIDGPGVRDRPGARDG